MLFGIKEPEPDYEAIWNEYSAIEQRMQQDYEDELAAARADLSRRGIAEGSESWEAAMQTLDDKRQTRMDELGATEAGQILRQGYDLTVSRARTGLRSRRPGDELSGDDFQQTSDVFYKQIINRVFGQQPQAQNPALRRAGKRTTRQPVSMAEFYESQFGKPEMAAPAEQAGESVESAAAQAAQTRARRAASGGFSPWW